MDSIHITPSEADCRWAWDRYKEAVAARGELETDPDVGGSLFASVMQDLIRETGGNLERTTAIIWCGIEYGHMADSLSDALRKIMAPAALEDYLAQRDVMHEKAMRTWATNQGKLSGPAQ